MRVVAAIPRLLNGVATSYALSATALNVNRARLKPRTPARLLDGSISSAQRNDGQLKSIFMGGATVAAAAQSKAMKQVVKKREASLNIKMRQYYS